MTDLTEQWKKGELPAGRYWVKYRSGRIDDWDLLGGKTIETKPEIVEVLAPVPSYEEWQELKEASDGLSNLMFKSLMNRFIKADEEREKLAEENKQLKELLKEWVQFEIEENPNDFTVISERMSELANKTKQAIGEK